MASLILRAHGTNAVFIVIYGIKLRRMHLSDHT